LRGETDSPPVSIISTFTLLKDGLKKYMEDDNTGALPVVDNKRQCVLLAALYRCLLSIEEKHCWPLTAE